MSVINAYYPRVRCIGWLHTGWDGHFAVFQPHRERFCRSKTFCVGLHRRETNRRKRRYNEGANGVCHTISIISATSTDKLDPSQQYFFASHQCTAMSVMIELSNMPPTACKLQLRSYMFLFQCSSSLSEKNENTNTVTIIVSASIEFGGPRCRGR